MDYFNDMWRLALSAEPQGIWFWCVCYLFLVSTYSFFVQFRTRFWPFVMGDLLEAGPKKLGGTELAKSDQQYVAGALYTYRVSGKEYTGSKVSPWIFVTNHNARFVLEKQLSKIEAHPNGKVKVFYHPGNPRKAYLLVAGKLAIFVTLVTGIAPIFLYYLAYHG